MSEFKGTKGPWYVDHVLADNTDIAKIRSASDQKTIAELAAYEFRLVSINETNANAKLISKAPELLEMLKYSLEALKVVTSFGATKPVIERIEKLIKEATEI
jgi:hypothetical protein